jgi:hypothetical protein
MPRDPKARLVALESKKPPLIAWGQPGNASPHLPFSPPAPGRFLPQVGAPWGFRPFALPLTGRAGLLRAITGGCGSQIDQFSAGSLIASYSVFPLLADPERPEATLVELSGAAALARVKGEDETRVLTLLFLDN